jgi:hypothetical protein
MEQEFVESLERLPFFTWLRAMTAQTQTGTIGESPLLTNSGVSELTLPSLTIGIEEEGNLSCQSTQKHLLGRFSVDTVQDTILAATIISYIFCVR